MTDSTVSIASVRDFICIPPQPALAYHPGAVYTGNPDCPHGNNYGSVACLLYLQPNSAFITETNFNRYTMTMPAYLVAEQDHILQGLWTYSGSPCESFVESAYVYGFDLHNYYEFAVARYHRYPPPGEPPFQSYFDANTSNDGGRTQFQHEYLGGSTWQLWRDGSLRAQFGNTGGSLGAGACIAEAGLEVSKRPGFTGIESTYVAYTANHDVFWYDNNRQFRGGWADGRTEQKYQAYPCYVGQVPPNCLNGQWNSVSQWSANKP